MPGWSVRPRRGRGRACPSDARGGRRMAGRCVAGRRGRSVGSGCRRRLRGRRCVVRCGQGDDEDGEQQRQDCHAGGDQAPPDSGHRIALIGWGQGSGSGAVGSAAPPPARQPDRRHDGDTPSVAALQDQRSFHASFDHVVGCMSGGNARCASHQSVAPAPARTQTSPRTTDVRPWHYSKALDEDFEVRRYRGFDGCLAVGVEPLQTDSVGVGHKCRVFPVDVGPDLAAVDALRPSGELPFDTVVRLLRLSIRLTLLTALLIGAPAK